MAWFWELTVVAHVGSRCSGGVLLAGHGIFDFVHHAGHVGRVLVKKYAKL